MFTPQPRKWSASTSGKGKNIVASTAVPSNAWPRQGWTAAGGGEAEEEGGDEAVVNYELKKAITTKLRQSKMEERKQLSKLGAKRLVNELRELKRDPLPGMYGGPRGEDLSLWDCIISGPPGTPWEGGIFQLIVSFSANHPYDPPHAQFKSRIFHPNVYPDGRICMDILDSAWNPYLSTEKLLFSIQSILDSPNLESPANPEAAKLYSIDRRQYNRKVRAISAATCRETEDQLSSENGGLNIQHPENLNQAGSSDRADVSGSDFGLNREDLDNLNHTGPSDKADYLDSDFGDDLGSISSATQECSQPVPRIGFFMRCFGCSKS